MTVTKRLRTLILAFVPYRVQRKLLDALIWLVQHSLRSPSILYRGHRVYLLRNDPSSARIIVSYWYWREWHRESAEQLAVQRIIDTRSVPVWFVDGGASFGMYSFLAASLANVKKVIAVEAAPSTFRQLLCSVRQSSVASRIDCIHGALTDNEQRRLSLRDTEDPSE